VISTRAAGCDDVASAQERSTAVVVFLAGGYHHRYVGYDKFAGYVIRHCYWLVAELPAKRRRPV
jgi:hypothetical protein